MKRALFVLVFSTLLSPQLANAQLKDCDQCEYGGDWGTQRWYYRESGDIDTSVQNPHDVRARVVIQVNEPYTVGGRRYSGGQQSHIWVAPNDALPITIHNEHDENNIKMEVLQY
jgi:hypothetical protein